MTIDLSTEGVTLEGNWMAPLMCFKSDNLEFHNLQKYSSTIKVK